MMQLHTSMLSPPSCALAPAAAGPDQRPCARARVGASTSCVITCDMTGLPPAAALAPDASAACCRQGGGGERTLLARRGVRRRRGEDVAAPAARAGSVRWHDLPLPGGWLSPAACQQARLPRRTGDSAARAASHGQAPDQRPGAQGWARRRASVNDTRGHGGASSR